MADETPTFRVDSPPELTARLRAWGSRMRTTGRVEEFILAVETMNERLKKTPDLWGDPLKEYKHILALEARGIVQGWFIVWYGVAIEARYVRVRDIRPAPGSPLDPSA